MASISKQTYIIKVFKIENAIILEKKIIVDIKVSTLKMIQKSNSRSSFSFNDKNTNPNENMIAVVISAEYILLTIITIYDHVIIL